MANDPKVTTIFYGLQAIIDSVDKSPAKERDKFAPISLADQFNKLREAAMPFIKFPDLVPAAVRKGLSGDSVAHSVDLRIYAVQIRDMLPYEQSFIG
jgi:hypothetical protein